MTYTIGLHNDALRITVAVILAALGLWATARFYQRVRPVVPWAIVSVVAGGVLAVLFTIWLWPDGPCGAFAGLPLAVYREHTGCIDVVDDTGVHVPLAVANAVIALGLGHTVGLAAFGLRRRGSRYTAPESSP